MSPSPLVIAGVEFSSRLFVGTGKFSSGEVMRRSLEASGTQLVTVALGRVHTGGEPDDILGHLDPERYRLLPNTSGTRSAREAVLAAELAREALGTNWLKLEIHPDPKYLMPDPIETLEATELLVKRGFVVLPYVHADPVLCKRLEEAGAAAVMPLGSPIGSNLGLESRAFLEIIIAQSRCRSSSTPAWARPPMPPPRSRWAPTPSREHGDRGGGRPGGDGGRRSASGSRPGRAAREAGLPGAEARPRGGARERDVAPDLVPWGARDMTFTDLWRRHDFGAVARRIASKTPADVRRALGRPRGSVDLEDLAALLSPAASRLPRGHGPGAPPVHGRAVRPDDAPLRAALPVQRVRQRLHVLRVQRAQQDPPEGALRRRDPRRRPRAPLPWLRQRAPRHRRDREGRTRLPCRARCASCGPISPGSGSRSSRCPEEDYAALAPDGLSAVLVYQETYDPAAYARHHLSGPKADMAWRLETPDRMGRAGIKKIGLGALFGLSDWRADAWFTGLHLRHVETVHWRTRTSISFPRLRPHEGEEIPVTPFNERDLVQAACAFRLLSPETELSLSTRESEAFRNRAFRLGLHLDERGLAHEPGRLRERARLARAVRDRRQPKPGRGRRIPARPGLRARLEGLGPDLRRI